MPRKPGIEFEFVMFDVTYEDGSLRSKTAGLPRELLEDLDGDKAAYSAS